VDPSRQNRQLISLALAGVIIAPVIIPAALRSACSNDPLARHYTTVALNLQLAQLAALVLCMVTVPLDVLVFVLFFFIYGCVWFYTVTASFISDRKARTGTIWTPPIYVPFFQP
jgi:hypothetical protein